MAIATPESISVPTTKTERLNREMSIELSKFKALTTRRRQPFDADYYSWEKAQPELVSDLIKENLVFVSHVEFAPTLYAAPILSAAGREGATALADFIYETWLPEETQHGVVTRRAAIVYAIQAEAHDKVLSNIPQMDFTIGKDYNVGEAATYGRVQELITHLYYSAMARNTEDPVLKEVLNDLAAQEMFHSRVYRMFMDYAEPEDIIRSTRQFRMPGHITSPELQKKSSGWAEQLGFDFARMRQTLAKDLLDLTGYEGLGRVVTSPLIRDSYPTPIREGLVVADRMNNRFLNKFIGQFGAKQVLPYYKAA